MTFRPFVLVFALGLLGLSGCRQPRFTIPDEAVGRTWFPAPATGLRRVPRCGVQILENPRRGVQEVWYRHRHREGVDAKIDELHGAGSLLWSPNGRWLAISHRDYASLADFTLFHLERTTLVERGGMMDRVQELWQRLHPEPLASLSVTAARWAEDGSKLLLLVVGTPEGPNAQPRRQAMWLDPEEKILRLTEAPEEVWAMTVAR